MNKKLIFYKDRLVEGKGWNLPKSLLSFPGESRMQINEMINNNRNKVYFYSWLMQCSLTKTGSYNMVASTCSEEFSITKITR